MNPQQNQFQNTFSVPSHTHNGVDSPLLNIPTGTVIYGGWVNADGTANTPFPSGWTSSVGSGGGVGRYTLTHNLGTTNYVIVVIPTAIGSAVGAVGMVFDRSTNSCTITMLQTGGGGAFSPTDTAFQFILLPTTN